MRLLRPSAPVWMLAKLVWLLALLVCAAAMSVANILSASHANPSADHQTNLLRYFPAVVSPPCLGDPIYGDFLTSKCSLSNASTKTKAALLPTPKKSSPRTTIIV